MSIGQAPVHVSIVIDSRDPGCADCFGCADIVAEAAFVSERLRQHYGDAVRFEFVDLAGCFGEGMSEVRAKLAELGVSPPVVMVNGALKLAGVFSYRSIAEAIDTLAEVGRG